MQPQDQAILKTIAMAPPQAAAAPLEARRLYWVLEAMWLLRVMELQFVAAFLGQAIARRSQG
jgi:hypothetical protein